MITDGDVERWLCEDVGHHDVTNQVPGETTGRLVAKEDGVVAGLDAALAVFEYLGVDAEAVADDGEPVADGDRVTAGQRVLRVRGPAREVLRGERPAVNVASHASGVATATAAAVAAAREGAECSPDADPDAVRVAATRKTTPGLRGVEKRAVVAGGGDTHRLDLSHMVMVKENHVAELGFEGAIERFRERVSFATQIEVEVERPEDGVRAAEAGADVVLFDNLDPDALREGVAALPADTLAEASGGIGLDDVPAYAATGVDVISMGSLTHSADALDLSFYTEG
ncbi:carboxylating nicotinate-nucleotide diphosphorylase [Halobaculum sp. MBLA0147]|uniref:carboxylating nicotinate-nucleotide diphosphorylase n=1 Tax=Halobaculum sp. MBLA0147 TaxID=3079934 RepID=UPI003524F09F